MPKNNKNRNAFYFFMLEFKNRQGRSFHSMKDVADAAAPHWRNLSNDQKQKYVNMAKQNKDNQDKQTSLGESVDIVLQEELQKKAREQSVKQEIDNIVKRAVNTGTIKDQYFYVMHINEFCYWERGNRHYPAEIAVGKFSLRNGIQKEDIFHALVHPGPLPLGYSATAKIKADETHQIPHIASENNIEEVIMGVLAKLTEDDADVLPPIYVSEKDILMIENVLGHMCEDQGQRNLFTLFSLQYLLFSLRNSISRPDRKWPTITVSKLELERDIYDFCHDIACDFHEASDSPLYCSKSQIIRWAYITCDNCAPELDINLIPGRHVPINAAVDYDPQTGASTSQDYGTPQPGNDYAASVSSVTTRSSRYQSNDDDDAESVYTVISETDATSYHGFDSDSQVADDEGDWRQPRRTNKHKTQPSDINSQASQSTQASVNVGFVPGRRPVSQSAAAVAAPGRTSKLLFGRGRGRGINRPPI